MPTGHLLSQARLKVTIEYCRGVAAPPSGLEGETTTVRPQRPAPLRSSRLSSDLGVTRSDMDACDAASIADCAASDPTARDDLYGRHGGACLALARKILVDAHYAEDTVQEVFLHL